ncbi:MAG TPA: hypothetical protein VNQ32_10865 [Steroidobacteraceae bacterium]|nr:hypothetical protein [Steroidobacteraceae bacterium]
MLKAIALLCTLVVPSIPGFCAEPWKAVFVTDEGVRLDYSEKTKALTPNSDQASRYRFEFNVPAEGNTATIRLLPVGENTDASEDYDALILARGTDMLVLLMVNAGLQRGDRFETYTLYPKLGVGFLTETSSYLGNATLRQSTPSGTDIPAASAKAFPLRRIDK